MLRRLTFFAAAMTALVALASPLAAQNIGSFEKNLTVKTLENGLTVMIYERDTAPVVSFFSHVDVGAAQEVPGITGLAHMFEHMAFKGTTTIGTKDIKAEQRAIAEVDSAYAAMSAERDKPGGADAERLAALNTALEKTQEKASKLAENNEFSEIVDRAGGVGMNAFTASDETGYMFSLPANKLELWAYLESERFLDPVLREFYKERDVVMEERRMRTDSQPVGRMIEQFLTVAFTAHPYGQPGVGYMSDLQRFTREDAAAFYKKYYVPSNITVAIVGDVDAKKVMPVIEKYFNRLPAGPKPAELRTIEPKQLAEKIITMPDASQPVYIEGYHRPSGLHPDDAIYNAMADILSSGRTSRLYRRLVSEEKIAAFAGAFNGFPGTKYPNLMLFFGMTTPGHSNEEVQASLRDEIERMKTDLVTDEELKRVKTRAKAGLIRGLGNNMGIAMQIATYQARYGDWRELFRAVDKIEAVTKEDIRRVAQETFVNTNRTVAMIVNEKPEETN